MSVKFECLVKWKAYFFGSCDCTRSVNVFSCYFQVYVGTISPARDTSATYIAWGHSTLVSPWADVVATTEHEEGIVYADLGEIFLYQIASYRKKNMY